MYMLTLQQATSEVDLAVLKSANREMYEAYKKGQESMRKVFTNDAEFVQCFLKSFFEYYSTIILTLPEADRVIETAKLRLAQEQLEAIMKIFVFNKNYLDKNLFLFYTLAYVNDIVRKQSGNA